MAAIAAYVPDLLDRSKLAAVAEVEFVAAPADLATTGAATVVVDLSRPGVLEVVPALAAAGARVIGFARHTDTETIAAARAAGCHEVLARSAFFPRLADVLAAG